MITKQVHIPSDFEIASKANIKHINEIAKKIDLSPEQIEPYGHNKAKLNPTDIFTRPAKTNNKLILVTAINPTPAGEGKTTVTIGLADALNRILQSKANNETAVKNAIVALREPSLGPVFGIKGGAAGGGYAQVLPMEDINLHFTGDFHAIGAANNLLAAMIDNHIYQGNELNIDPKRVMWRRAMDMNDRQLRNIVSGDGKPTDGVMRPDGFDITVASEVMAVFCLAKDLNDLKKRLGNILVAYSKKREPIFAKDLNAHGAMTALLKNAINPNLVQTIEGTPAIVHGGPFANIAHGCNSVIATRVARHLSDYTITEAGFGADLGAEKFCNIKCRLADIKPDMAVIVATIRALKYNGGVPKDELKSENLEALSKGLPNLLKHIENMQDIFGLPVVVALNRFVSDTDAELDLVIKTCADKGVIVSLTEVWEHGSKGGEDLAHQVLKVLESDEVSEFQFAYDINDNIENKIHSVATKVYGASNVELSSSAKIAIKRLKKLGLDNLPICIAKTQYSFSDNAKLLGVPTDFNLHVRDISVSAGAGFIIVICGNIMKMPGLPKIPSAEHIDINEQHDIVGLF